MADFCVAPPRSSARLRLRRRALKSTIFELLNLMQVRILPPKLFYFREIPGIADAEIDYAILVNEALEEFVFGF